MYDFREFIIRGVRSLTDLRITNNHNNVMFKMITIKNLFKKLLSLMYPMKLTGWSYDTCIVSVNFLNDLHYKFYLAKNSDYNYLLNPYFHEYDITKFFVKTLKRGDVVIDVGAHAGLYLNIS
jgi:hypothetical protein